MLVINLISPNGRYDHALHDATTPLLQIATRWRASTAWATSRCSAPADYSMRIWLDPDKVAARNLTASRRGQAIREQNVQVAAGVVGAAADAGHSDFQLTVMTQGRLADPDEFANIIVRPAADGQITRMRDVGRVELGAKTTRRAASGRQAERGPGHFPDARHQCAGHQEAVIAEMEKLKQRVSGRAGLSSSTTRSSSSRSQSKRWSPRCSRPSCWS